MSLTHVDPHVSEIVMVWIQSGDLLMVWIQISQYLKLARGCHVDHLRNRLRACSVSSQSIWIGGD
jgi:hypothetical protein